MQSSANKLCLQSFKQKAVLTKWWTSARLSHSVIILRPVATEPEQKRSQSFAPPSKLIQNVLLANSQKAVTKICDTDEVKHESASSLCFWPTSIFSEDIQKKKISRSPLHWPSTSCCPSLYVRGFPRLDCRMRFISFVLCRLLSLLAPRLSPPVTLAHFNACLSQYCHLSDAVSLQSSQHAQLNLTLTKSSQSTLGLSSLIFFCSSVIL